MAENVKAVLCEAENPQNLFIFHYNPPSWLYRKRVNYGSVEIPGTNDPVLQFCCGGLTTIPLNLFLNEWGEEFAGTSTHVLPESERGRVERDIKWIEDHSRLLGPNEEDYNRLKLLFCWGTLDPIPVVISEIVNMERVFHAPGTLECLRANVQLVLSKLGESNI